MAKHKVIVKKLGRHRIDGSQVDGYADTDTKEIFIDSRLKNKRAIIVLCHEVGHQVFPEMSEKEIERLGRIMGTTLWDEDYRKVNLK